MTHARREELELYVLGALEPPALVRLEGHVRRCAACAGALAEEARLETTLRALVPAARRAPAKVVRLPERPAARRAGGWSGALAAAAALVVVWGMGAPRLVPSSGGATVAEAAGLVCEASAEEPLCRWPLVRAPVEPDNACRAPLTCPVVLQSRIR